MRRAWLVFNPVCGRGAAVDQGMIEAHLGAHFDVVTRVMSSTGDAAAWARDAVHAGASVVVASGGDGTVSAVAGALLGTGVPLGVVPRGTANSLAAALGLPAELAAACHAVGRGAVRRIDAARVNGRAMVLLCGVGFHADTVERTTREQKNKLGVLAYVMSGLAQLAELSHFSVDLETEDKIVRCRAMAVTVANVAPPTTILARGPALVVSDDGLLDVTIVASASKLSAVAAGLNLWWSAAQELPASSAHVGYFRCRRVRVVAEPPQRVIIDGETVAMTPLDIECLPAALAVVVPAAPARERLHGLPGLEVIQKGPP